MREIVRKIASNITRVQDRGDCYYLFFWEAKDFNPENIKICVEEKELRVSISKPNVMWMKYYCDLPDDIKTDSIIANMLDCGLEITIPKVDNKTHSEIPISGLW